MGRLVGWRRAADTAIMMLTVVRLTVVKWSGWFDLMVPHDAESWDWLSAWNDGL